MEASDGDFTATSGTGSTEGSTPLLSSTVSSTAGSLSAGFGSSVAGVSATLVSVSIFSSEGSASLSAPVDDGDYGLSFEEQVEAFERNLIRAAMRACDGSETRAARWLRLHRTTLHGRLKKYG